MSAVLFEGAAGTGKTTRLVGALREHVASAPLAPEQRVLALTKFHGSRRRMEAKLRGREGIGRVVDCVTLDSFGWRLVRRWRGLVRSIGDLPATGDFPAISSTAGTLLQQPSVAAWVARRYPLVAVDEMQDCKGGEVEILAGLARAAHLVCAADAFQDLAGSADCEAIRWARTAGPVVALDLNHRTRVDGLLTAARALREAHPLGAGSRAAGFEIVSCPTAPVAGSRLAWCLQIWGRSVTVAVISPTKPGTSPFVDGALAWMATHTARSPRSSATAGPFRLEWEPAHETASAELAASLKLSADPEMRLDCAQLEHAGYRIGAPDLCLWLQRERTLAGRSTVSVAEVRSQIGQLVHRRRAYGRVREARRIALTVHQAKNREFDCVVVLWPMRVQPDPEQQRRLLYNAITRARQKVLIIVEDPKSQRLETAPFC